MVTIFGNSALASDRDAHLIMSEAWGEPAKRQFELFEMIDVKPRNEVRASWAPLIFSGHNRVCRAFGNLFLAIHPRRTVEAFLDQYIEAQFLVGNTIIEAGSLGELHAWYEPLLDVDKREDI